MTTPETATATNEELLRKVIEAQAKGGYSGFDGMPVDDIEPNGHCLVDGEYWHILEILLDTNGCKAAYGDWSGMMADPIVATDKYMAISIAILRSWHSGKGNNVCAALKTATEFLQKP